MRETELAGSEQGGRTREAVMAGTCREPGRPSGDRSHGGFDGFNKDSLAAVWEKTVAARAQAKRQL